MQDLWMRLPSDLIFFQALIQTNILLLTASPFPWMEATYRYAEIKNRKYGPSSYSGNQTLKDKGFDVKVLDLKRNISFPAVAIGFRDIAGTGLIFFRVSCCY